jgi:hypothetical protein
MPKYRFVEPDIVRLPLSDGDWIEVKRELTAGEQRKLFGGMVRDYDKESGRPLLDPERVGRTRLSAYLLDWSFVDRQGKPVALNESAIDNLDVDTYAEINKALDVHEEAVERARKNPQPGEPKSAATSPSVA